LFYSSGKTTTSLANLFDDICVFDDDSSILEEDDDISEGNFISGKEYTPTLHCELSDYGDDYGGDYRKRRRMIRNNRSHHGSRARAPNKFGIPDSLLKFLDIKQP
jgi:hypothetical protein